MGQQLVLGIHQPRHDVPLRGNERSLRLLAKALAAEGVELSDDLIHGLALLVEAWPCPVDADVRRVRASEWG